MPTHNITKLKWLRRQQLSAWSNFVVTGPSVYCSLMPLLAAVPEATTSSARLAYECFVGIRCCSSLSNGIAQNFDLSGTSRKVNNAYNDVIIWCIKKCSEENDRIFHFHDYRKLIYVVTMLQDMLKKLFLCFPNLYQSCRVVILANLSLICQNVNEPANVTSPIPLGRMPYTTLMGAPQ